MAVENALFVGGLNNAYPAGSEFVAQGDDHLRLVKSVLLNTFPGFVRAIDAQMIPMSTYPGSPDTTSVYAAIYANKDAIAAINAYLLTNPLGDALRANNNLSDVANAAVARSNLNAQEAGVSLLIANNLNDLSDAAAARSNLGVAAASETLLRANNLLDVADPAIARSNLGVPATSAVLLRADNLASLTNVAAARSNLGVSATADVLLRANNLSDITSAAAARANLGVSSTAQMDAAIATAISNALASITSGVFIPKAGDFTFGIREDVRIDVTAGPVIATLEGTPEAGAFHVIVISGGDVTTNNITLTGPDTINGAASVTINVEGYHFVFYNGTDWTYFNLDQSAALANHIAAANPHSQYLLITDLGSYLPNWVTANNAANFTTAPSATGTNAQAWGNAASAPGADQIAIGNGVTLLAGDADAIAIGRATSATKASIAIGQGALANGTGVGAASRIAIGKGANAGSGSGSASNIAIGYNASANAILGGGIIVIGANSSADAQNEDSVVVGAGSTVSGTGGGQGVFIGAGISSSSGPKHSVAIGYGAQVIGDDGVGIGSGASSRATSVAVGRSATGSSSGFVAIGASATVGTGLRAIAIGMSATVAGSDAPYAIAIGYAANSAGFNAVALGRGAAAGVGHGVALGPYAKVDTWQGALKLGGITLNAAGAVSTTKGASGCMIAQIDDSTADATPKVFSFAIKAGRFFYGDVYITAKDPATGDVWGQRITFLVKNVGGTAILVGTPQKTTPLNDAGLASLSADVGVSGANFTVTVTGIAATSIEWAGHLHLQQSGV